VEQAFRPAFRPAVRELKKSALATAVPPEEFKLYLSG
jgi:hypothetical protein